MQILPIVDLFYSPIDLYKERHLDFNEVRSGMYKHCNGVHREGKYCTILNAFDAAKHQGRIGCDPKLESLIEENLKANSNYKIWQQYMPSQTPQSILKYRNNYKLSNFSSVSSDVNSYGAFLSPGQCLFHGGQWRDFPEEFVTERPLSTTFSPQVALRNSEHNSKAIRSKYADLIVITVISSSTKIFVPKRRNYLMAHEMEVLFASGAKIEIISREQLTPYYSDCVDYPIYLVRANIS